MKGDRFEKMVERNYDMNRVMDHDGVWKRETAKLLRKEHAAVKRMVKKELLHCITAKERSNDGSEIGRQTALCWECRATQCHDILAALAKRAKGGTK